MQEAGALRRAGAGVRADRAEPAASGDRDLPDAGEDRRARRVVRGVGPRRPGAVSKAGSRMPRESSRKAPRPTWRRRRRTAPPTSSPRWPTRRSCATEARAAIAAAEQALAHSKAVKIRFLAARVFVEAGAVANARALLDGTRRGAAGRAAGLRQDHRRTSPRLKSGDRARRSRRSPKPTLAGHLDRPLRSRARLSRGRRVHAGRFRVRSLHQAPRRGAVAVPRRGTDVRLFPAGLLLPGPRPEGLNSADFAESYRDYLEIRGKSPDDPLATEVRKRSGI